MRAWVLLVAALVPGCISDPPGADEVLCGWEKRHERTAPEDRCARFVGTEYFKAAPDACAAPDAPTCVIVLPGQTISLYADPFGPLDEGTFTRGDCEQLACP